MLTVHSSVQVLLIFLGINTSIFQETIIQKAQAMTQQQKGKAANFHFPTTNTVERHLSTITSTLNIHTFHYQKKKKANSYLQLRPANLLFNGRSSRILLLQGYPYTRQDQDTNIRNKNDHIYNIQITTCKKQGNWQQINI